MIGERGGTSGSVSSQDELKSSPSEGAAACPRSPPTRPTAPALLRCAYASSRSGRMHACRRSEALWRVSRHICRQETQVDIERLQGKRNGGRREPRRERASRYVDNPPLTRDMVRDASDLEEANVVKDKIGGEPPVGGG